MPPLPTPQLIDASGDYHYYKFVQASNYISWSDAKLAAEGTTMDGMEGSTIRGYLATITSSHEDNYVTNLTLGRTTWVGGSDDFNYINQAFGYNLYANQTASEGHWYWVTGPEAGKTESNFVVHIGNDKDAYNITKGYNDNFKDTIISLLDYCQLDIVNLDKIEEVYQSWISYQYHYFKDRILNDIIESILNNTYYDWKQYKLTLVDEALIQYYLRQHNIEIKCYNLNSFPTNTDDLRKYFDYVT